MKRANCGSSQYTSRCEYMLFVKMSVRGPRPMSWYAIQTPSMVLAQRILGTPVPANFMLPRGSMWSWNLLSLMTKPPRRDASGPETPLSSRSPRSSKIEAGAGDEVLDGGT